MAAVPAIGRVSSEPEKITMFRTPPPTDDARGAITRLIQDWGLWRDTCRWEELRAAYAPEATMTTTWFDGKASDFVDASMRMSSGATLVQHFIGPSTIDVHGARAIAETRLILLVRGALDGIDVDVTCYARFYDRLVWDGERWLILSRTPIYEKDTLQPVAPGQRIDIPAEALARHPRGFCHLAHVQASGGATITAGIPAHNSEAQASLYREGQRWLAETAETGSLRTHINTASPEHS